MGKQGRRIGIHHCSIAFDESAGKFEVKGPAAADGEVGLVLTGEEDIRMSNVYEAGNQSSCRQSSTLSIKGDTDATEYKKDPAARKQRDRIEDAIAAKVN